MKRPGFLSALLLTSALTLNPGTAMASNTIHLPSPSDTTSGIVSQQQEYELGRTWLKILRSQPPHGG